MCVRGKLDEFMGEMILQSAGLELTFTCVSHVYAVMRDFHRGGGAFDNAGGKLEVRFADFFSCLGEEGWEQRFSDS